MKLLDFVVREAILVDLQATGKEEAIREMVGRLHRAGRLSDNDVESVIRAIASLPPEVLAKAAQMVRK